MIAINNLSKIYSGGFQALQNVDLEINQGEIFALLGPNGAGKTTLISIICGLVNPSSGTVSVGGFDILRQYKHARGLIGLVPQELTKDAFETVWDTVSYSRGLFGKKKNPKLIEKILKDLYLWDKKDNILMTLSGGMKRRVMIAKALSHEPKVLFLDEPTAGVDVELRKSMWDNVRELKNSGVTIILTTHYIEEAEEMADRVGVISAGKIIVTEKKDTLMNKLGTKELIFQLSDPINELPEDLNFLTLASTGQELIYTYDSKKTDTGISKLLKLMDLHKIDIQDINSKKSSLEEIFVNLVKS